MFDPAVHPHRRYNPLTREWVLVSPHRTQRPWQGQVERTAAAGAPTYDPGCYLCPGNARAGGVRNPDYTGTFVFDNDFAALLPDTPAGTADEQGLLVSTAEAGICRVVCFSPRHDLTLATLDIESLVRVVQTWTGQYVELGARPQIGHVQIFENRGEMMGASNPHPHGQIWATATVPDLAAKEHAAQTAYAADRHGACLLCDYVALERARGVRVIWEGDTFIALVPFWAVWPFETILVSRHHVTGLDGLSAGEQRGLADVLSRMTRAYDRVFDAPFPYSMGIHQRPTDGLPHDAWHLHVHFFPPLLRSATIRKFMVGFELLGMPQRDLTPEAAAERLRAVI